MTRVTPKDYAALNDRLQVVVGTSTRQRGQINALNRELEILKERFNAA